MGCSSSSERVWGGKEVSSVDMDRLFAVALAFSDATLVAPSAEDEGKDAAEPRRGSVSMVTRRSSTRSSLKPASSKQQDAPPHTHSLHDLPVTYAAISRRGAHSAFKRRAENQDSLLTLEEFAGRGDQFLACVFDGHGPNGGFASRYVRDCLPGLWSAKLLASSSTGSSSVFEAAHAGSLHKLLHEGCVEANRSLSSSNIDVYVSGSAGIAALVCGNKLFVANVGDCRCVVGARSGEGIMDAVDMSTDHEPTRTEEEKRILAAGGRIFEWGVPRVWLRDVDMPGLAMSRSFGDLAAESVGVHSEPEIKELVLTTAHRLMIMASDGIWEFISSQEAVDIVAPFADKADPHAAAEALVREAVKRWTADEEAVDDITVVVAFFNYPMPSAFVQDHPECGFLR